MTIDLSQFNQSCRCGKSHALALKKVLIERGAINKLPQVLEETGPFKNPVMICDTNTYDAAGSRVSSHVKLKRSIVLEAKGLHADETAAEKVISLLGNDADLLIAAGSGTIHDITRYAANAKHIPFISLPTAPSVDGFVSTVSAMTWHGFKKTFPGVSPISLVADSDVFAAAPKRLTASGVGDLLGKYTALLDWKTASLLTDEYICEYIIHLEREAVNTVAANIEGIRNGDVSAIEQLMYGLVLSGIAMQMAGNSRPASGSEHHMAHLWEMNVINKELDALHGEKVGVGFSVVCDEYRKLLDIKDIEKHLADYKGLPVEEIEKYFGPLAPAVLEENRNDPLCRIDRKKLCEIFPAIQTLIKALPAGGEIRKLLSCCNAPYLPEHIGLDSSIMPLSCKLSPFVRNRLTLMRIKKLIR